MNTNVFKRIIGGLALTLPGFLWAQYPMPLPPENEIYPNAIPRHQPGEPLNVNKATKIIGMTLRNQNNEKLGTVRDLILDLKSQRVAYAWVEKADSAAPNSKFVAVPLDIMQATPMQRRLVLNVEKQKFDSARSYAANQLPNLALPVSEMAFWKTISEAAGAQPQEQKPNRPPWPYRK